MGRHPDKTRLVVVEVVWKDWLRLVQAEAEAEAKKVDELFSRVF